MGDTVFAPPVQRDTPGDEPDLNGPCPECGAYPHGDPPTFCTCRPPEDEETVLAKDEVEPYDDDLIPPHYEHQDDDPRALVLACPRCGALAENGQIRCPQDAQHPDVVKMTRANQKAIDD